MFKISKIFLFVVSIFVFYGCSIDHRVADDYNRYLINNIGGSNLPKTNLEADYHLTDFTKKHHYEFRSATVGYANLWIVDFGKILEETLKSQDIKEAFGRLSPAVGDLKTTDNLVLFDLQNYEFSDFGAHISLRISLFQFGQKVFNKVYGADGKSQGAKMFWAGVFGMKNAIQQSTKLALDQIFKDFIKDINESPINTNC